MWYMMIALAGTLALGGCAYLIRGMHRFSFIRKFETDHRFLSWILAAVPLVLIGLIGLSSTVTLIIVYLHLFLAFAFFDLVAWIVKKASGRILSYDFRGCFAILLTVLYLGVGCFLAFHVFRTEYTFQTAKPLPHVLRITAIADAHLGVTLDGKRFSEQMERIRLENPDLVVVIGDFVDDGSSREDMEEACRALGSIHPRYGTYYVFGNHDNGYYRYRDFSGEDLRRTLRSNSVTVLEDESVLVDDSFYLIGRRDRSFREREDIDTLMSSLDRGKYCIVLDHQPNDYASEAAAGADLVLSGHTHGGHVFPAGLIGYMMRANDRIYGTETRGSTQFLVTSGISGWEIPIKTWAYSEYVVIDVHSVSD